MKFYTTIEIAEMLKVQKETISRAINRGELKAVKLGRIFRVNEVDLINYLTTKEVKKDENIKSKKICK